MRRYYSHYAYIYPDLYLKNSVVELDDTNRIIRFFPFEKEIENTEFYSGVLVFLPNDLSLDKNIFAKYIQDARIMTNNDTLLTYNVAILDFSYVVYDEDGSSID